uniref:Uncharacterized protein n=1 Tax=Anguilla anguilla TaxID=7936 RepID=A0A0E9XVZ1_ANGAN
MFLQSVAQFLRFIKQSQSTLKSF